MKKILDTNVPIIANGDRSAQATPECRLKCRQLLEDLMKHHKFKLVIDLQWIVLKEYRNNLDQIRNNGLGNQFLQWVLTNLQTGHCVLVQITQKDDSFLEFPNTDTRLNSFDPADRKWIAVALAHQRDHDEVPPITQAADLKWKGYVAAFSDYGIGIDFICDAEQEATGN